MSLKRRAPYVGTSSLPDNGYVRDLAWAVEAAAQAHGAAVRVIKKNGDRYLAVLVPNETELAAIDAAAGDGGQ